MRQSFTVRDLPASERPRERLEKYGAESLSAQELLALILGIELADHVIVSRTGYKSFKEHGLL